MTDKKVPRLDARTAYELMKLIIEEFKRSTGFKREENRDLPEIDPKTFTVTKIERDYSETQDLKKPLTKSSPMDGFYFSQKRVFRDIEPDHSPYTEEELAEEDIKRLVRVDKMQKQRKLP